MAGFFDGNHIFLRRKVAKKFRLFVDKGVTLHLSPKAKEQLMEYVFYFGYHHYQMIQNAPIYYLFYSKNKIGLYFSTVPLQPDFLKPEFLMEVPLLEVDLLHFLLQFYEIEGGVNE